jgi:mono/diheme cytochrome c family protein
MNRLPNGFPRTPGRRSFSPLRRLFSGLVLTGALLVATGVLAQTAAQPEQPPDARAGLVVYGQRCANCHGNTALGDGELARDLPNPPAALADPAFLRAATPSELFETITDGRIPQGMPPFGDASSDPLSEATRWDVISAIYSLGTPIESVEQGEALYVETCQPCHGADGRGDGPEATGPPGDLTLSEFWATTSNQSVYDILSGQGIADHQFELSDDQLWATVDYLRTFSYAYTDALAAFRPLEVASISGQVENGTTGEIVGQPLVATLRAFTQALNITLTLTETVGADGRYTFNLTDVPQEWFYRVGVSYNGIDFSSGFGQLSFSEPVLDLPITVFEQTTDPSDVLIERLHIVASFADGFVQVGELYVVSNVSDAVFMGESGRAEEGTFRLSLPPEATSIDFQRGFGSVDSFIPTSEVIFTGDGWADTLPVRPGTGLLLLVQYVLPYDREGRYSHQVYYDTAGVTLVLAEAGVRLDEADGWTNRGLQSTEMGSFTSYSLDNLAPGAALTLSLEGRPRSGGGGPAAAVLGGSTELLVGGAAALIVLIAAALIVRRWRQEPEPLAGREELLLAIAELDEAFEAGELDAAEYEAERDDLKAELMAIWEDEQGA